MKTCSICEKQKDINEYPKSKGTYEARCRECAREYARNYYKKNKEASSLKRKEYYKNNKDNELEKQKKYYQENKETIRLKANAKQKTPQEREKANARSRKWAKENRERHYLNSKRSRERNPERHKAHQYVNWALRLEVLKKPENCSKCERRIKVEGHHTDYSKPLEVVWLCRTCHLKEHGKLLDVDPRIEYDSSPSGLHISCDKKES